MVTIYLFICAALAVISVVNLGESVAWLGAAIAQGGALGTFVWIFLAKPARTNRLMEPSLLWMLLGLGLLSIGLRQEFLWLPLLFWLFAVGGFIVYLAWFAPFFKREFLFQIGEALPPLPLTATDGQSVEVAHPAILLFYRGNWCPFCVAQVGELAARYQQIAEAGGHVYFVSPQPAHKTAALADQFDVDAKFLVDKDNETAKALGIEHKNGTPLGIGIFGYEKDTVMPTIVITDAHGRLRATHETDNYRVRPEPETYLHLLLNSDEQRVATAQPEAG